MRLDALGNRGVHSTREALHTAIELGVASAGCDIADPEAVIRAVERYVNETLRELVGKNVAVAIELIDAAASEPGEPERLARLGAARSRIDTFALLGATPERDEPTLPLASVDDLRRDE